MPLPSPSLHIAAMKGQDDKHMADQCRQVLSSRGYRAALRPIFEFYASFGDRGNVVAVGSGNFVRMVRQCDLLVLDAAEHFASVGDAGFSNSWDSRHVYTCGVWDRRTGRRNVSCSWSEDTGIATANSITS